MTPAKYRSIEEVSRSSWHSVQRVTNAQGRRFLLKTLQIGTVNEVASSALRREFEALKDRELSGVPRVLEIHTTAHGYSMLMEDVDAVSLQSLLPVPSFDLKWFLETAIKLSVVLAEVHRLQLIHGNVSPNSILISRTDDKLFLINFNPPAGTTERTQDPLPLPTLAGELVYISPEQTGRMNRAIDYRTDFYSLGATLYEILTGAPPFKSDDPLELIHCHIARRPQQPAEIDSRISAMVSNIVMKLLSKNAEERYQSALGLREDLQRCLEEWITDERISSFLLGQRDVSDRFLIPQTLYGRTSELSTLLEGFEKVCEGPPAIALVTGSPGIGKTSLIQELYKPIVRQRGYFASGKFDQLIHDVPFGAMLQALRGVVQQLLTEGEDRLLIWRNSLLDALGANAGLICEAIPEIEKIIGKQTTPPLLAPTEAHNRFQLVFQQFIGCLARKEHPLVIFLDDLQWADPATLRVLQPLLTASDVKYLYVIGSYRDTEIDAKHPLTHILSQIEVSGALVQRLSLDALNSSDVLNVVCDIVHGNRDAVKPLADLVLEKTAGNPFFVIEFMKTLHDEGLLTFDFGSLSWTFEVDKIAEADMTDNVLDLMTRKIERLSPGTQDTLKLAACIGNEFDLEVLATVSRCSLEQAFQDLGEAVNEGLLIARSSTYAFSTSDKTPADSQITGGTYRFLHDQLRQASYNLIGDEQRASLHFRVGRLMRDKWSVEGDDSRLFEIVHQLNLGTSLLTGDEDRLDLARLNLKAGQRAKASTAFQNALDYFKLGRQLLTEADWSGNYALAFDLNIEAAECEYLCGDFVSAETDLETLLQKTSNSLDKARVHNLRVVQYENTSRYDEALTSGREALALFGFSFADSAQRKQAALEIEIESIKALLGSRKIESLLDLPVLTDPEIRMVMNVFTAIWPSAYLTGDVVLTRLISAIMVRLSLVYGNSEESAYGYVTHAITVGPVRGDYKSAYEFGKLALSVNEHFNDSKRRAKIYQQFQAHVNPWRRPLETCIPYAREACRSGLDSGDFTYANYGAFTESWAAMLTTNNLSEFVETYAENLELITKLKFTNFADALRLILNRAEAFRGNTDAPWSLSTDSFSENDYVDTYRGNPFFMNFYHLSRLQLYFHFGKYQEALDAANNASWIAPPLLGTIWPPVWEFWRGLCLATTYEQRSEGDRQTALEELERAQASLARLADNCPQNFHCQSLLLSAELERLAGRNLSAFDLYDEAIKFSRRGNQLQNLALSNELCAKFWQDRQHPTVCGSFVQEAIEAYAAMGASAKVRHLEMTYNLGSGNKLATAGATTTDVPVTPGQATNLDLATAMKAAQAISGEIDLSRLLERLMSIVIENAGAERGSLILERDGEALIESEGTLETIDVHLNEPIALEQSTRISQRVVNYVRRSLESLVITDASTDDRYVADPYIQEHHPHAIMCVPIIKQGQLIGVMYLENNLVANAFTPDRIELVQLLASEAAISLENAMLYEEMKNEVRQRKLAEETLRSITEGTASVTGGDFFYSLVRHLATALQVRYAFVAKCVGPEKASVRTLAFWNGEAFADNVEYELEPTPCSKVIGGEVCHYPDNLQELFPRDYDLATLNAQSFFGLPLANAAGEVIGHLVALDDKPMNNDPREMPILKIFAARAGAELERLRAEEDLRSALVQVEDLKNRLQAENIYLQEEISKEHPFKEIVGSSPPLLCLLADVERVAPTSATVLILGETGTGKELIARAIHNGSGRKNRALVKVNCGAISAGLVESELFGHTKGAFTGAIGNRVGRFELADGGTLFLDEVSELPLETQVKLLRVLQEGEFEPVGSSRTVHVDVRIIAASNRDLEEEIKAGRFRPDLFYRLNVLPLKVPSLKERASDIPQLVMFFLSRFSKKFGKNIDTVTQDTMQLLANYPWPGNIRELQNVIERAVVLAEGPPLHLGREVFSQALTSPAALVTSASTSRPAPTADFAKVGNGSPDPNATIQDVDRNHILGILKQVDWVIEGPKGAARVLNLHPNTLRSRMKKLGISRAAHEIS